MASLDCTFWEACPRQRSRFGLTKCLCHIRRIKPCYTISLRQIQVRFPAVLEIKLFCYTKEFFATSKIALSTRLEYPVRFSSLQEFVFLGTLFSLYVHFGSFALLFLLDTTQIQFAFSMLPAQAHESWVLKCVAGVLELALMLFWAASAHFGVFHSITFVRVVQTSLLQSVESLKSGYDGNISRKIRQLRKLQLALNIFNLSTSGMVFDCTKSAIGVINMLADQ